MYVKYGWKNGKERKFVELGAGQRIEFAERAKKLCDAHPDIHIHAIVVKKQNVQAHIQRDPNKLYNYMIRRCLLKRMAKHDVVTLIPDPRSIKVASGNSLPDYLQTELWFTEKAITQLVWKPEDSNTSRGVQFADMIAGIVQARWEKNQRLALAEIASKITMSSLFF